MPSSDEKQMREALDSMYSKIVVPLFDEATEKMTEHHFLEDGGADIGVLVILLYGLQRLARERGFDFAQAAALAKDMDGLLQ